MATTDTPMPARLAESAFHLFSRRGFKQVNIDQVAAQAGVTKGSFYWHYRSKDELINSELAHITNPVKRLEKTLEESIRTCLLDEENRVFTTEILTLALHDAEVRRGWQQFYDSVREFYVGLVRTAMAAGGLHTPDPERAVEFMLATMEGVKLQAMYNTKICSEASAKAILANLKRTLGFPASKC